jgi:hypothetical protein
MTVLNDGPNGECLYCNAIVDEPCSRHTSRTEAERRCYRLAETLHDKYVQSVIPALIASVTAHQINAIREARKHGVEAPQFMTDATLHKALVAEARAIADESMKARK